MDCLRPLVLPQGAVPCGKCPACLKRRQSDWALRMMLESEFYSNNLFVTLTYDDDNKPTNGFVSRDECQRYIKRLRKFIYPHRIRYFLCGEYGAKTYRPHYHAVFFGYPEGDEFFKAIDSCWSKGFVTVERFNQNRAYYVAKYISSVQLLPKRLLSKEAKPFSLMSRRPGLGFPYLSPAFVSYIRNSPKHFVRHFGYSFALPRYFREKIFDTETLKQIRCDETNSYRENKILDYIRRYADSDFARLLTGDASTMYDQIFSEEIRKLNVQILKKSKL